jgi:hypothetical protein
MARQLTMEERDRLAQLHHRGFLQNQIAEALGRNPGTISRELARNRVGGEYFAAQAQELAERRRRERPQQRKLDDPELNEAVPRGLVQNWSPEQIAGPEARPSRTSHATRCRPVRSTPGSNRIGTQSTGNPFCAGAVDALAAARIPPRAPWPVFATVPKSSSAASAGATLKETRC